MIMNEQSELHQFREVLLPVGETEEEALKSYLDRSRPTNWEDMGSSEKDLSEEGRTRGFHYMLLHAKAAIAEASA